MVRVSLFLAIAMAVMMILSSLVMRIELTFGESFPIIQLLFNGDYLRTYIEVVSIHGTLGVALLYATSAYIAYLSDCRGAMSGRMWGNIALVLIAIILTTAIVKAYGYVTDKPWHDDLLINMENQVRRYTLLQRALSFDVLQDAGIAILVLACSSIICTSPAYRIGAILLATITFIIFFSGFALIIAGVAPVTTSLYLVPEIVMLALLSLILLDPERRDEPHLMVGVGLTVVATLLFDVLSISSAGFRTGSYLAVAEGHFSQNGLAIFGFFAAYMANNGDRIKDALRWGHAVCIAFFMSAMYLPLAFLGASGVDRYDVETAMGYPMLQWLSSLASFGMFLTLASGVAYPIIETKLRIRAIARARALKPAERAASK